MSVSLCRGMASKALLMSIVVKSVLCAGLFELMPSKTCCVRLVSWLFVECTKLVALYIMVLTSCSSLCNLRIKIFVEKWINCNDIFGHSTFT